MGYYRHDDYCDLDEDCSCEPEWIAPRQGPVCLVCLDSGPTERISEAWFLSAVQVCALHCSLDCEGDKLELARLRKLWGLY